ncbi:MAG: family 10 glycosylhydrolase [Candidatus Sumerlaeaceae bacterium]|nr:family 10 glycosylhydrolase [Candidatus Sumerlaeaceae bacterium]
MKLGKLLALVALCAVGFGTPGNAEPSKTAKSEQANQPEVRAVWASTLAPCMNSPEEIRELVAATRRANLNTIIAQVRHRGITYYNSSIEPRAAAIRNKPDFDPLAELLKEAHDTSGGQQRLDVYAWFNVFALGKLDKLDIAATAPLYRNQADWRSRETTGSIADFMDAGLPEVQDYLISVVAECVGKYDVDGVNFDYIRYPEKEAGYHPRAIERFNKLSGRMGGQPESKDPAWAQFRRDQVTNFVRRAAVTVWQTRPNALVTMDAIGFGGPPQKGFSDSSPYKQVFQDWNGWLRGGWMDVICRMGYKSEALPKSAADFRGWADFSRKLQDACPGQYVTVGIGGYMNTLEGTLTQYLEAQKRKLGTSLFSYNRPLKTSEETKLLGPKSPFWDELAGKVYTAQAPPVRPEWRKKFGVVAGFALDESGHPLDGVRISLKGKGLETKSDGSGFFAFAKLLPGKYEIAAPGSSINKKSVEVKAGQVVVLNK